MSSAGGAGRRTAARELRTRLLQPPAWMRVIEWLIERLPRRQVIATAQPLRHLRQFGTAGRWATTGRSSLFILDLPQEFLSAGWAYIEAAIHYSSADRQAALYFDTGNGFDATPPLRLVGNKRGSIREVFRVPPDTLRIGWTPTLGGGVFHQSQIVFHAISAFEARLRMLERVWTRRKELPAHAATTLEARYEAIRAARLARTGLDYDALYRASASRNQGGPIRLLAAQSPHFRIAIEPSTLAPSGLARQSLRQQTYRAFSLADQHGHESPARTWLITLRDTDWLVDRALELLAGAIATHPAAVAVYSDHDCYDDAGVFSAPSFKPDWNFELFLTHDFVGQLCAVKDGTSADGECPGVVRRYQLALRLGPEARQRGEFIHLPMVLCHRALCPDLVHGGEAAPESLPTLAAASGCTAQFERRPDRTFDVQWPFDETAYLVTVIIPTRNQEQYLSRCIDSIQRRTRGARYEILVIDNQSDEPAALAYLETLRHTDGVRVKRFDRPFNYAAINNFAVSLARGSLLAFVNNDVEVIAPDWLVRLAAQAIRPDVGAVGAKLLYSDDHVQHAGVILGIGGIAGHVHRFLPGDAPGYCGRAVLAQQLSAVTAACMVVEKDKFLAVGGFDAERFAIAFNDIDLCLRLNGAGYRSIYEPAALLYHHESISRGPDDTPNKRKIFAREAAAMRARWGQVLQRDPFYNPNLSLDNEGFEISPDLNAGANPSGFGSGALRPG